MCSPCTVRGAAGGAREVLGCQSSSAGNRNRGTVSMEPVGDPQNRRGEGVPCGSVLSVPSPRPPSVFLVRWPLRESLLPHPAFRVSVPKCKQ